MVYEKIWYGWQVVRLVIGLLCVSVASAGEAELASLIAQAERQRDLQVHEVRSTRQYVVRNARWKEDATMDVRMITSSDGSKRFEILKTNAEGLRKTILTRIVEGEVAAAAKKDRDGNVNASNYELRPLSGDAAKGAGCQMFELVARKRTRFTFDGRGCVDMKDMAMVRMEGRTTRNMSWLVGRAYVVQEFRKVGDLWYSSLNQSKADVRFLGTTELIIKYLDYSITKKPAVAATGN
jgi:hypothetical protein